MSISILRLIPQIATMINKNKLQFTKRHGTYLSRDALAIGRWLSTRPRIQIQILPRPSRWRLSCFLSCGWRSSWRWRSLAWWWPWGSLWRWYCPKSFFAKCRETVSWRKKCKKTKRKKRKKCKKRWTRTTPSTLRSREVLVVDQRKTLFHPPRLQVKRCRE